MEGIRQDEYFCNIPPARPKQTHQGNEDAKEFKTAFFPFSIHPVTPEESKTQILHGEDRIKWFALIVKELNESSLLEKEVIEEYLRHMYRQMCKGVTVENAYRTIHYFLTYLKNTTNRSLREISRNDIEAFVEYEQDRGLKPSSVRLKLVTLRAFIRFLIEKEYVGHDVLTRKIQIKLPELLPRAIDPSDLKQFLNVVDKVRDKALILLLLRTGMRIGELLSTKVCDVNIEEQKIMIYQAEKTRTGRVVYLSDDARIALERWLNERDPGSEYLFCGRGRRKLSYGGAREIFRRYLRKAGLMHKGYGIHRLRHTFASELLNAGMRLECLQKLLGHTSIEVTRRYAKLTDKTREEEYFRAMERIEKGEIDGYY